MTTPTTTAPPASPASPRRRGRLRPATRRERGIALVTVLIAIAITLVVSNQFGSATSIDMIAAANYRDQMRSHFLARSALNLSELVIRLQQRIDNIKQLRGSVQITDFADQVLLAFCGSPEEVQAAVGFTSDMAKGLGADIGTCGVVGSIKTDDDKINLNCANGNDATAATLASALDALVYFPAYDPIFEEADAEGWRRDRKGQVDSIIDYIDANALRRRERGTTEDYGYESLRDPYRAKNTYLDSVGEAKLARGVDDRFWTLFGSSFTVYGSCKINLSALTNSQLIASILQLTAKNQNDPVLLNPQRLFALASLIAKAKLFGMTFAKLDDFISFVKDPAAQIGAMAASSMAGSGAASAAQSGQVAGLGGGDKVGLELDRAKLATIASAGPRRTYRIEAYGELERKQKLKDGTPVFPPIRSTITGVFDMTVVPQNLRKPGPKGAWVYLREE
jgi:Tfp pilus assembly protein PilX